MLDTTEKLYDVMLTEILTMYECFLPLAQKLNIPVIGTVAVRSWQYADAAIGNSYNPAVVPIEVGSYTDHMTFFQRLVNLWEYLLFEYHYYINLKKALKKINEEFYSADLVNKKKVSLLFINNHHSIMTRSLVPNAIEIAGIHLQPVNPLPEVRSTLMWFSDGHSFSKNVWEVYNTTSTSDVEYWDWEVKFYIPQEWTMLFHHSWSAFHQCLLKTFCKIQSTAKQVVSKFVCYLWLPTKRFSCLPTFNWADLILCTRKTRVLTYAIFYPCCL